MTTPFSDNPAPVATDGPPLPAALERVRHSAERVERLKEELEAEMERRDRAMLTALDDGHPYRAVTAAAHRGDGHATTQMVQNAIKKYG